MNERRVDRVTAAGCVVALAGCLLPLVVVRANRIVAGVPHGLGSGGVVAWLVPLALAAALASAVWAPALWRARAASTGALLALIGLMFALGRAASAFAPDPSSPARVSIGAGAWIAGVGAAMVWFEAHRNGLPAPWRAVAWTTLAAASAAAVTVGGAARLSIFVEYSVQGADFWSAVLTHLWVAGLSLAIAIAVGTPLGVLASRHGWVRGPVLGIAGVIETVPSLALLGLLLVPLAALGLPGIGPLPAVIALTLYALLPVIRGTYVGLAGVDPAAVDAGRGMGMGPAQLLARVEAPLALPLFIDGVRTAAVLVIGITAVVAFVGVGTLGVLVFLGWGQQADDLTLLGAVPMVLLAVAADAGLRRLGRAVTSPGLAPEPKGDAA